MTDSFGEVTGSWREELKEIAAVARHALEPGLQKDAWGKPIPGGSCLYGSVLLVELVERFDRARAVIRGGSGEMGTGAVDVDGEWQGHYWVEVEKDGEVLVVDITGDQFGYGPVRVLSVTEARSFLVPGQQAIVDEAASMIRGEVGIK